MASSAAMEESGGDTVANDRAKFDSKENFSAGSPKHFKKPSTASISPTLVDEGGDDGHEKDPEKSTTDVERSRWVLNAPKPPGLCQELMDSVRETIASCKSKYHSSLKNHSFAKRVISVQQGIFPILSWGRDYKATKFKSDLMAGLTIASLCIPQVILKPIIFITICSTILQLYGIEKVSYMVNFEQSNLNLVKSKRIIQFCD